MKKDKTELTVGDVAEEKKLGYKKANLVVDTVPLDTEVKFVRLDSKKILEQTYVKILVDEEGREVKRKAVDSKTGEVAEKGSRSYAYFYIGDDGELTSEAYNGKPTEKVINKLTGAEVFNAKEKFLKFVKLVPRDAMKDWFIEDTYRIWGDNVAKLLKFAEFLSNNERIALFKWSPNGTVYHAFFYPVYDEKFEHFHILAGVCRLKMVTVLGEGMEIAGAMDLGKKLETAEMLEEV